MTRYRSAITGEFVTEEYAEANPSTTVAEDWTDEDRAAEITRLERLLAASKAAGGDGYKDRMAAIEARLGELRGE